MKNLTFHQIGLFVEDIEDLIKSRFIKSEIVLQQNKNQDGKLIGYPFVYTTKGNKKTKEIVDTINEKFIGVYKISSVDNIHTIGGKIHFLNNKTFFEARKIITESIPNAVIIPRCEVVIQ